MQDRRRTKRPRPPRRPPLTVARILAWADAHHARTGRWPFCNEGRIPGAPAETWRNVDLALRLGLRGLPGGDSLARLLGRRRGKRHGSRLPDLTEGQVAAWAQAHRARTGRWPDEGSGPVGGAPGEAWSAVGAALRQGVRGLPGGDTLPRLLARRLGARNRASLPRLSEAVVLRWADAHRRRTGGWPHAGSGEVVGEPGQTWRGVNKALRQGSRGLPGGSSLARLLAERRGKRNRSAPPPLTEALVLRWADAHHARTGRWPTQHSGPVAAGRGESWAAVNRALDRGSRGLPGGDSLVRLLRRSGRGRP
jgi:hypothetical protein